MAILIFTFSRNEKNKFENHLKLFFPERNSPSGQAWEKKNTHIHFHFHMHEICLLCSPSVQLLKYLALFIQIEYNIN
jgi:hypothetical protein